MIIHEPAGTVTITREYGQYVAKGAGHIGYGNTPREALLDWRAALKLWDNFDKQRPLNSH